MNGTESDWIAPFRAGFEALRRYPVMVVPELAAQGVMVVLTLLFVGGAATMIMVGGWAGMAGAMVWGALLALLNGLLSLVAAAVVILMAREALGGREPSLPGTVGIALGRLVDVVVASLAVMVIVSIGLLLLVIPGIVAGFFLLFTLPVVLLEGRGAIDALGRSVTLVKENMGPTVALVVGMLVVMVATAVVAMILGHIPILGRIVSAVLLAVVVTYGVIAAVRTYETLPRR